jgi:hypothetical protein
MEHCVIKPLSSSNVNYNSSPQSSFPQ